MASFRRKPESSLFNMFSISAFAGVTSVQQDITFGNYHIQMVECQERKRPAFQPA